MSKNILIPMTLFMELIELLEYWDISNYDTVIQDNYRHVFSALNLKLHKMELRDAYSKIVAAKNSGERDWARIEYLKLKNSSSHLDLL